MGQQIHQPILGIGLGAGADALAVLLLHQADGGLHQIADDGFHVAAHIADLGELGGLDLDEGRVHQLGQAAGDFGLAHARRADHENVLRSDLFADVLRQLRAAIAVAQRHGDGALRLVLADDKAVKLPDDFARGKLNHGCLLSVRPFPR